MKKIRLTSVTDTYFQETWKLYEDAFPLGEQRGYTLQTQIMSKPQYHFELMMAKDEVQGFLLWWDLNNFRYIDHFATTNTIRNKGIGTQILEEFIQKNEKPILLEVELPETPLNQRRIKFYERLGFKSNPHYHEIPGENESDSPLQLMIMTYPKEISLQNFEAFKKTCESVIY